MLDPHAGEGSVMYDMAYPLYVVFKHDSMGYTFVVADWCPSQAIVLGGERARNFQIVTYLTILTLSKQFLQPFASQQAANRTWRV